MKAKLAATGSYSIVTKSAMSTALESATTGFKRGLIEGHEALSLATLKGTAKAYSSTYRKQADKLISDLRRAGLVVGERTGDHGKRILTIAVAGEF